MTWAYHSTMTVLNYFVSIYCCTPDTRCGDVLLEHGHQLGLGQWLDDHFVGTLRDKRLNVRGERIARDSCAVGKKFMLGNVLVGIV